MTKRLGSSVLYPRVNEINKYLLTVYCGQITLGWSAFKSHPTFQSDKSKHCFFKHCRSHFHVPKVTKHMKTTKKRRLIHNIRTEEYSQIASMDGIMCYVCMCGCVCVHETLSCVCVCPYAHLSTQKTMSVFEGNGLSYSDGQIDINTWIY